MLEWFALLVAAIIVLAVGAYADSLAREYYRIK